LPSAFSLPLTIAVVVATAVPTSVLAGSGRSRGDAGAVALVLTLVTLESTLAAMLVPLDLRVSQASPSTFPPSCRLMVLSFSSQLVPGYLGWSRRGGGVCTKGT
jgi:hypothetical protein